MVVPTFPMHVTMGQLIGRCFAHIGDLYAEVQRNTS